MLRIFKEIKKVVDYHQFVRLNFEKYPLKTEHPESFLPSGC